MNTHYTAGILLQHVCLPAIARRSGYVLSLAQDKADERWVERLMQITGKNFAAAISKSVIAGRLVKSLVSA